MLKSVLTCTGVLILASGCAFLGLHPLAMFLFAAPAAVFWAEGRRHHAAMVVAGAGCAGVLTAGSLGMGISYALAAALGLLLGLLIERRQSYGRCVSVLVAVAMGLLLLSITSRWSLFRDSGRAWLSSQMRDMEAEGVGNTFTANAVEGMRWFSEHWDYVILGSIFAQVLLGTVVLVSLAGTLLQRRGVHPRPAGSFQRLRPPDWLVWAVIAVALCWFADQRWPQEALRVFTWNAALGLACVYWLNGFSCLVFGLNILRPGPVLYYLAVFLVFVLGVHTIVATFGLFDTWWDFRRKLGKVAAARRLRAQSGGPKA